MREDSTFVRADQQMVNLQNVSTIKVIKEELRIVFNMNYHIDLLIGTNTVSKISDYVYWDCDSVEELSGNLFDILGSRYFRDNFISQIDNAYINKNEIGSVKFDHDKMRVIFNLSHPVTFKRAESRCTSEFVYVNCLNLEEYQEYIDYLKTKIF